MDDLWLEILAEAYLSLEIKDQTFLQFLVEITGKQVYNN
jgi:hypothetical protein